MGNLSGESGWERPIASLDARKLKLENGMLSQQGLHRLIEHTDPYLLAPYVQDREWLRSLIPRLSDRYSRSSSIVVRANHATLLIEYQDDAILIDPGERTVFEGYDPSFIFVTHAHSDHSGGLIEAARLYPRAAIVMTPETLELLQSQPGPQAQAISSVIEERGYLRQPDDGPFRISDTVFRLYPAGHLLGAAMLDIQKGSSRLLVTGDFSLRELGGLPGGGWPTTEFDVVIMESSHAWDTDFPTADPDTNRLSLIAACQQAIDAGASKLIVLASALGEAQEAYFALCQSQMWGAFPRFTLRMAGKAAIVASSYRRALRSSLSPWSHDVPILSSGANIPPQSIVIVGGFENADGMGHGLVELMTNAADCAIVTPVVGSSASSTLYSYSISLHASLLELYATAVALRCQQVALYHGHHANPNASSPLTTLLQESGRRVTHLKSVPQLIGDVS